MQDKDKKRILLTGGGTAGSVTPLLAVAEEISADQSVELVWLGTKSGPEKRMVEEQGIKFLSIASGKLHRYFDWRNFFQPFKVLAGFFQSFFLMLKWRPDLVMSAGGFVGVPAVWAAWFLRVPALVHQQDVRPGLANKLIAPMARVITVTFEKSLDDYGKKAVWIGNPVRQNIKEDKSEAIDFFKTKSDLPTILVVGGGTGATAINDLIWQGLDRLIGFCRIIHLTGMGKGGEKIKHENYQAFEFLDIKQMAAALHTADLVISRCGLGILTELSFLGKPAILIPMPNSHQEDNAQVFAQEQAALVLDQKKLDKDSFIKNIKNILADQSLRRNLSANIKKVIKTGANEKMVEIVRGIFK